MHFDRWATRARLQSVAIDVATGLPIVLLLAALGARAGLMAGVTILGLLALAAAAWARARRFDRRWITLRLDAEQGAFEDSAGLLLVAESDLGPLQRLQRDRLLARLSGAIDASLRPAWPWRLIGIVWAVCALLVAAAILTRPHARPLAPAQEGLPAAPGLPHLVGQRLRIVPPAYTGLPPRDLDTLDGKAPAGSRIEWVLHFDPQPATAAIERAGGGRLALTPGDDWTASQSLAASMLYRVVPAGGVGTPPLHRIDAIPDKPPTIRVLTPDKSLSLVTPGQKGWSVAFEVDDDYGVASTAQLRVTLASGEGENIVFHEHAMTLTGSGPPRARRFATMLDLKALGFTGAGDLVVQLTAADTRAPGPQSVRGPSLILRWPPQSGTQSGGLEAMAQKALPAYFASERQIIMDSEALLREKPKLTAARFLDRSDRIAADQANLRNRYAQFMGQESEGPPAPTSDSAMPIADDDHPTPAAPAKFGDVGAVTAEYGHAHDEVEGATLFDPETRATLKAALDAMWDAERHLRTGDPAVALPFENKALIAIKKVQQATRIFLARTGTQLPPIDEGRRMTGKRDGIADRAAALDTRPMPGVEPSASWAALAAPGPVSFDRLEVWLRGHEARVPDRLALDAAIDGVRRAPGCAACRAKLRGLLWTVLPRPIAMPNRRSGASDSGRHYLEAIGR